jgi:NhaC family Na+:H+ antiporter
MTRTAIPSIVITTIIFLIIGRMTPIHSTSLSEMTNMISIMKEHIQISSLTLISPLLVILLAVLKIPVVPVLIVGIITAGITATGIQEVTIGEFLHILQNGTSFSIQNEQVSNMMNNGGLQSMMWSISLILIAFAFGGLLDALNIIPTLLNGLIERVQTKGQLILSTATSSIGVNILTGEQYMSILIPGQSFKGLYNKLKLDRKYLSRTLEDAGTLINPLIPWGVSGAFFSQALDVHVMAYIPFAFYLYLSPLFSILFGFLCKGKTTD